MKIFRRALAAGAAAGAAALAWTLIQPATATTATDYPGTEAIAEAGPGYAVEDYAYPEADKVLEEQNILLKRGDGHIVLAACGSEPDLLEVYAREKDKVCFKVTGKSGFLTMEIPAVYGIKGNDYDTQVDMTVGTEHKSFDVPKNTHTPVGESADEQGRDHMLVEIRSSK